MLEQNKPSHILEWTWRLAPTSMHRARADKRQPGLRHYLLLLLVQNTQNPINLYKLVGSFSYQTADSWTIWNTGHTKGSNNYVRGSSISTTGNNHHL